MNIPEQDLFVISVAERMLGVLLECNKKKDDCVCSFRVSYLNDTTLPENMRYRTSIYCANNKGDPFHSKATSLLEDINRSVDIMNPPSSN